MEKKILRAQLYSLFVLTTLNLIYFYYRDSLPDNYYEISYQNNSINYFSYYFISLLANFGYWCGIWITLSFIVFALLNTFVLTKNKDVKHQVVIVALLPLTMAVCYFLLPVTLGEGLFFFIQNHISSFTIISSIFIFGLSFFYLVSEKKFFKTGRIILKTLVNLSSSLRDVDFSSLKKIEFKSLPLTFKRFVQDFVNKLRKDEESPAAIAISPKFKISHSSEAKTPVAPKPTYRPAQEVEEEIEEILEEEDEFVDEAEFEEDEEFIDSVDSELEEDEEAEDFEDVESPYVAKTDPDPFFESDELISCIVPKDQTNHQHDPDDHYFVTIAQAIEEKLKEFNISSRIINVLKGPVVDTFELDLGPGVKVNAVTNRVDDLSLALKGAPIRMVYPMKGKTTIGIEVPRNPRDLIYLDEVLRSNAFKDSSYRLPIAMG